MRLGHIHLASKSKTCSIPDVIADPVFHHRIGRSSPEGDAHAARDANARYFCPNP
jgi:hypothetical protein